MQRSLCLYGGKAASRWLGCACLIDAARGRRQPATSPCSEANTHAVLSGWIDNGAEIARLTDCPTDDPSALYAAALETWGDAAQARLIGNYAAIAVLPDGRLHLARSPWSAPPLYYASDAGRAIASPLLRVLFAAGVAKDLDYARLADELAFDFREGDGASWYRGIASVPLGASVTLDPAGAKVARWYDPGTVPQVRHRDERDYVAQARSLLDEASARALATTDKAALALSGGLDSPLVADSLLRCLPAGRGLDAITFIPDPDWDVDLPPGIVGDELPIVREFAAMHPRLALHVADPALGGFDYRARDIYAAMDSFVLGLANVGMYHGVYAKAVELGCDTLLNADLGNQSISDDGRWAYVEYARRGKWGQLLRLLANRPGDSRPLWRKLLALSVLPQLPAGLRGLARALAHPGRKDMTALLSPLSPQALAAQRKAAAARSGGGGQSGAWDDFTFARDRQEAARADHAAADRNGIDITLAFEQIYGVATRDVTAYRPLIEYCLGLPTEQFAFDGMDRRLARRMAEGAMPEAQRLTTGHGFHNIDMHARVGRRRGELAEYCTAMRDHPVLSQMIDIDRVEQLLAQWPERAGLDIDRDWPRMMAIPRAIMAARFIGHVEGRNDL
ncbi:MAG: hypothetical protein IE933_09320 [Sphingomonadales bacterium]|nr:hypothetical protein [Sphingomonadales bacterium]MBD3772889.1 hypothetical protein [Paracoccaceae bacterium]